MSITVIFFLGLIIALIGVVPPGLLNMTVAKISLKDGHTRAIVFALGVCTVVFLQTYIAAMFARYMNNHPDVVEILQRVAFVIFVLITIYFFFVAKGDPQKDVEHNTTSKHSRFFQGIFLSAINVFPIPYQAYMTMTITNEPFGWFSFDTTSILTYCSGATTGTFVMLYMYMFFFDKMQAKTFTSQKNMNRIIGSITGVIAVVTLVNILMEL